MVFTSIPAYIDPANWQQQQPSHQQDNTGATTSHLLLSQSAPPSSLPSVQPHGAGGAAGSIRPGSMADRARMANIPMQETPQKCPRCESTNTKFCYFNNYSLSQPRHFCKTCRRYWTRGGALRNVPVGGGCRRNKRSKGSGGGNSSSKSPASSDHHTASANSTNSVTSNGGSAADMAGHGASQMRFMAPLHQLGDHFPSGGDIGLNYALNYSSLSGPMGGVGDLNFHIGSALGGANSGGGGGSGSILSSLEQWRMPQTHQFPFLAGLDGSSHGLYPFEGSTNHPFGSGGGSVRPKVSASGMLSQVAPVKVEESGQGLNLSRQLFGMNNNSTSEQFWNAGSTAAAAWTDLSGFSSTSTTSNQL